MQGNWMNFLIVVFVTLGSFSYGYSASIIASTLGQSAFVRYLDLDPTLNPAAESLQGATNGIFQTGGFFGALLLTPVADRLSRRGSILMSCLFLVIGGALQAASVHIGMFLAMRFITGMGVGMVVGSVPLYQSEVSPPKIRGLLVGLHGVMISVGYSTAGWIGYACYPLEGNIQWRLPLGIQCIPPGILALGTYVLPESPRWLLQNDRADEAFDVIRRIHGEEAQTEFTQMCSQAEVERECQQNTNILMQLRQPHNLKRLLLGFGVMFGGQTTGTLVLNNYGVSLYTRLGYSGQTAIALTAGWVTVSIPGNFLLALFVDRIGRVRMLLYGFIAIVCILVGEMIATGLPNQSSGNNIAAIFFLYCHIAVYSLCIDATTYIYVTEIFPTHLRAIGSSISISGLFLASIIYTQSATSAFASIGWKYYLVFTITSALMVVCLALFFPETKGLSLEEIGTCFGDPPPSLCFGDNSTSGETQKPSEVQHVEALEHVHESGV
ncbi:uncharacterized protein N7446_011775 [Penicillium canescens]|uniref:Major facilitator superfamily (MFS) profile domain-containing protein n=1 Tax=Penicillium canescens TaxID=5083 RepID=A0AAD6IH10_PENCN|nr:uncharacterized protein N7446_011775 [Penicillium canescens]KAJ6028887.1 hypothetical protein N7444_011874 [Penicillium canescens]KAJ6047320.1 hypothetical protein N7460_003467 [Penicillium canescens]KAJ6049092.1 hypothetical protein N7446_011775 [Penicillium canescens]